ncbi:UDP-N-acetylmuramoyl-L-alanine--D-glutamate ligase [Porphyromonas gingivalis]|uniref:UDP-N-acetylmuramoyl-L-alanine--D-glutamate ligase n=1 Tax=Porphyromonas gingivalis TaxID=837 RepID=UPI002659651F|nr:UDP-N-acetylmuramoyl-L-alanine--D-glutamate ligase [Porphyromonas gingivalis]MDP0531239.1 UDP-N-acetylmuramoyl-L-alanine--D-glutamate ligase [Porphyromonas gingivalis]MDP0625478.1 UDP-N-acetylmuramoyl-L-alanine--D-glutamate ligase [Porphyromonas gingivalis]WKD52058.1 UDP-N-acetylmuramoyl-L-alanine--D-glutamate ligase [Porphyromonas gingivalis]WKD54109.1 UDP-N-acetylmuramoyl-L-alanine--D-glutamate ligase [Porphyromonas gingivalis]
MDRLKYDIVVLGAGESGVGAALLAQAKGLHVFVSDYGKIAPKYKEELDRYTIPYEEGRHTEVIILEAKEIIKSPGIPDTAPIIRQAVAKEIGIVSEIEFAGRYTDAFMVCITGSNGKTTTTMWLYHTLCKAGLDVGLAGNVGFSLARQVAYDPHPYYVIELSSFQLDNMYDFRANVAILLNITPDHLDRYDHRFELYAEAKMRITRNQQPEDCFIYWEDDPFISRWVAEHPPVARLLPFAMEARTDNTTAWINEKNELVVMNLNSPFVMDEELLALSGMHNRHNAMATAIAAKAMDIKNEAIREALQDFKNVPHRLEKIARVKGVDYINDSKATNVNSTWYALESMKTRVILILGGTDKGNDYTDIENLVLSKVDGLIFLGIDNEKLHKFFDGKITRIADASSMHEAVSLAYRMASKGDTVLLSPACASFDLFQNYEDRGDQFRKEVLNL